MALRTERMTVTAACSVNLLSARTRSKNSAGGHFKGEIKFRARLVEHNLGLSLQRERQAMLDG